eukprot:gene17900-5634_t
MSSSEISTDDDDIAIDSCVVASDNGQDGGRHNGDHEDPSHRRNQSPSSQVDVSLYLSRSVSPTNEDPDHDQKFGGFEADEVLEAALANDVPISEFGYLSL